MPTEKIRIEFNQTDIKELIAERYGLQLETVKIYINHYKGEAWEPEYTSIIVEGQRGGTTLHIVHASGLV